MSEQTAAQLIPLVLAGALEGAGVPWPGIVIVAGAGIAAGGDWVGLGVLSAAFTVAYCLGALAQYVCGRALGPVALAWLPAAHRSRLEALMQKHGAAAVLWSRPLAIGNYVSAPAGMLRMPLVRFLLATFFGILPWAFGVLLAAGWVGNQVGGVQEIVARYTTPLVAAVAVIAGVMAGYRHLRRHMTTAA